MSVSHPDSLPTHAYYRPLSPPPSLPLSLSLPLGTYYLSMAMAVATLS
jgi:hypothetical protein